MSGNVYTYTSMSHVYTTFLEMYIHASMYMYIHFWQCIYASVHGMYMVCTFRGIDVFVHCSDAYVHVNTTTCIHQQTGMYLDYLGNF